MPVLAVLAVIATLGAVLWTAIVFEANAMSDAVGRGFQFGGTLMLAWLIVIAIWAAWWVG